MTNQKIVSYLLENGGEVPEEETWYSVGVKFGVTPPDAQRALEDPFYAVSSITKKTNDIWRAYCKQQGEPKEEVKHSAKILLFDIETAPIKTYVWRRWGQNIYTDQTIDDDWAVLTWSAKWLFNPEMMSDKMTVQEALDRDDKRVVTSLWKLLDEADIIIAHNGMKFDTRMMNGRFFIHGLIPPSSYQQIDTLRAAKKQLALPSYKLDDLAGYLGHKGKIKTEFNWWSEFLDGKQEAIDRMQQYNDQDVYVLEELYLKLRPWIKPHPNLGLHIAEDIHACPSCGGTELSYIGEYVTTMNVYKEVRCNCCGSLSREKKAIKLPNKKKVLSSLPK